LALPANPEIASWYRYGPAPTTTAGPGETGATVIAAHVDSLEYGLGPFAALADAVPGTEIVVSGADGSETLYRIDAVTSFQKTAVDWNAVFDRTGPARLTLVTCGGEFNRSSLTYDSNVIVSASPVQ
jgi:sortase (surface protein transpeptidase)